MDIPTRKGRNCCFYPLKTVLFVAYAAARTGSVAPWLLTALPGRQVLCQRSARMGCKADRLIIGS